MYIIDKIEENTAVCEHDGKTVLIDVSLFSDEPHEGMCFYKENDKYVSLDKREQERRNYADSLLNKLFAKNKEEE